MWTAIASLIGAGLAFAGGLIANRKNKEIADQNVAYQKEANTQNVEMQKEINSQNIAFQQQENEITRQREDNAVQRAAADMTAAGLSKTLAAGHPASASGLTAPEASAPSVSPVNNSFKYESVLQKMQIAQFLQDMAVKGEQLKQQKALNEASIEFTKAQTENMNNQNSVFMEQYHHKLELENSQIAYNYSREESEKASARLTNLLGDYKGYEVEAEIALKVKQALYYQSQVDVNKKSIEKMAVDIAHSIADSNYLNKKATQAVYEFTLTQLKIKEIEQNLSVAQKFGYPVGYMPSGWIGNAMTTGYGIGNYAQFKFPSSGNINFTPYEQMVLGMSGNVGTYLPPVT